MSAKIKSVMFMQGFGIAVFDERGQQIPELQESPITLWAQHCEALGFDPNGVIVETNLGNWRLIKTEYGWNREVC